MLLEHNLSPQVKYGPNSAVGDSDAACSWSRWVQLFLHTGAAHPQTHLNRPVRGYKQWPAPRATTSQQGYVQAYLFASLFATRFDVQNGNCLIWQFLFKARRGIVTTYPRQLSTRQLLSPVQQVVTQRASNEPVVKFHWFYWSDLCA